jgi:hypothetical protein
MFIPGERERERERESKKSEKERVYDKMDCSTNFEAKISTFTKSSRKHASSVHTAD